MNRGGRVATGDLLDGRFAPLEQGEYDLPGVERALGRDTRLDTPVVIDTITCVAPASVRRAALRAMSVRDPRLTRVVSVQGGPTNKPTIIISEPLHGVRLDAVLARRRLDEAKAKAVVGEVARALTAASAAGVHHGWVRPACIAIDARGRVTIAGLGTDSELALQAGVRRGKGEKADATALSRVFLACITGRDPDETTAADLPPKLSDGARSLCEKAIAGKDVATHAALLDHLGQFDTRALRGLPSHVDSLPLSLVAAKEAEKRRKKERLEAARRALTGPKVTAGITIARETLVKAEVEAEAVTGGIPHVVQDARAVEEEPLEDLHDLLTFEEMVEEQTARAKPTVSELLYERLHERWPQSQAITKRLERAHDRAINGGPINATPILMTLLVIGIGIVVFLAVSALTAGISGKPAPEDPFKHYPDYTYGPLAP